MQALLAAGAVTDQNFQLIIEHALEPHQRSGEPAYAIAEAVLGEGRDINAINPKQGRTLLYGSANRGTLKPVQWLLDHNANPNALDEDGRTPLHVAAVRNTHTSVVEALVAAGADPGIQDASGKLAIDYARSKNRQRVVAYLAVL